MILNSTHLTRGSQWKWLGTEGTQEAAGGPNWGEMNLTDEGIKISLNAIQYMLGGARVDASSPDPKDGAMIPVNLR